MAPIRILHVFGRMDYGGAETMIMNIYRNIDRNKVQFDFICHLESKGKYDDEIYESGGYIYHCPQFKGNNISTYKKWWKEFFKQHSEYRILHSHIRSSASLYFPIAKKHGIKTIIHSHSTSNGKGIKSFAKKILQFPLRRQADYFFDCSIESGEWLFGKKIINGNRHYTLKNAIDVNQYKYNTEIREKYRNDLGIADKDVYIHVGRFHPAKNHGFLLEVFNEIYKKNENAFLLLIGDGDLRSEIEKKISNLGLEHCVRMPGSRSDIPELLQAADCFLFPSLWEGVPIASIEAQAAGLKTLLGENIYKIAKITDLCVCCPQGNVGMWVEAASDLNYERKDMSQAVIDAGYDIKQTSQWLQKFYTEIYE